MIIILEGENKCGKTTLANYIVKKYKFDYYKCSQPKGNPYKEYMQILDNIKKSKKDAVIDRFLYGEFVYGPLYRGKSKLTEIQKIKIETKAKKLNSILIYCYDGIGNIKRRFAKENEEFANEKLIGKTLKLFKEQYNKSILNKTTHIMETKKDLLLNNKIDKLIKEYGSAKVIN